MWTNPDFGRFCCMLLKQFGFLDPHFGVAAGQPKTVQTKTFFTTFLITLHQKYLWCKAMLNHLLQHLTPLCPFDIDGKKMTNSNVIPHLFLFASKTAEQQQTMELEEPRKALLQLSQHLHWQWQNTWNKIQDIRGQVEHRC